MSVMMPKKFMEKSEVIAEVKKLIINANRFHLGADRMSAHRMKDETKRLPSLPYWPSSATKA
jgi:hypothetical protein